MGKSFLKGNKVTRYDCESIMHKAIFRTIFDGDPAFNGMSEEKISLVKIKNNQEKLFLKLQQKILA